MEVARSSSTWFWPLLITLTIIGLIVRILFVTLAHFQRVANDAVFFRSTASNLIAGRGYAYPFPTDPTKAVATAAHPPFFSLLLAMLDLGGIQSVAAQRVALAVVTSSAVVVMGLVGRRALDPMVGVVAAAIAALHPLWLQTIGSLMSETIYLVAIPLVLLAAMRATERATFWRFVTMGLTIGIATLIRSEAVILLILLGLPVLLMSNSGLKARARLAAATLIGAATLLVPWIVRNEIQLGTASLSTQTGLTLAGSYCQQCFDPHTGYFGNFAGVDADAAEEFYFKYVKPPDGARRWNEVQIDHHLTHDAEHFARTHLGQLPRVVLSREVSTWALTGQGFQQDLPSTVGAAPPGKDWCRVLGARALCCWRHRRTRDPVVAKTADSLGADCGCRAHRGCHLRRHPLPGSRGAVHRRSRRDRASGPIPVVSQDVDCVIAAVAWPRADVVRSTVARPVNRITTWLSTPSVPPAEPCDSDPPVPGLNRSRARQGSCSSDV